MLGNTQERKNYVSIVGGKIAVASNEGDSQATRRVAVNPRTKEEKIKYEVLHDFIEGVIEGLSFYKHDEYGEFINITIDGLTLSVGTGSKYGTSFLERLPLIDLAKPIRITPYSFDDTSGKKQKDGAPARIQGLSITQDGVKLASHYYDPEKKEALNGIPVPPPEANTEWESPDWIYFFARRTKFLVAEAQKNPLVVGGLKKYTERPKADYPQQEVDADSIPF